MAEADLTTSNAVPNPSSNLVYFILITFIYLFFSIFNLYSSMDMTSIENNKNNNIINLIYVLVLVIGSYFININISKAMCPSNTIQWNNILFITILPWLIIFAILYFVLEIFEGWVTPFSNTIGYLFVSILGVESKLKELLIDPNDEKHKTNNELVKAINNINNNKSKFINEFDLKATEFEKFIEHMKTNGLLNSTYASKSNDELFSQKPILELYKFVIIKHIVGKAFWYLLAGILIASISYNFIINITCKLSMEEIKQQYDDIEDAQEDTTTGD
jgi:hypothetical protein